MEGGTITCETSMEKFLMPCALRLPDRHGIGRRGGLKADGEEDDLLVRIRGGDPQAIERRIDDAHVAALGLHLKQIAIRAGHAQHVAERAEDDVRAAARWHAPGRSYRAA